MRPHFGWWRSLNLPQNLREKLAAVYLYCATWVGGLGFSQACLNDAIALTNTMPNLEVHCLMQILIRNRSLLFLELSPRYWRLQEQLVTIGPAQNSVALRYWVTLLGVQEKLAQGCERQLSALALIETVRSATPKASAPIVLSHWAFVCSGYDRRSTTASRSD